MSEYPILFLGDVVGRPGREAVKQGLPSLIDSYKPLFVIVNGENSAGGVGITPSIADEFLALGTDVITLGNHAFNKREIDSYLKTSDHIIRPSNMAKGTPGKGWTYREKDGIKLLVLNVCGRVFMEPYNDPFEEVEGLLSKAETPHIFLDFHAEATSEKIAMGYFCEGRTTAVVGTHTHVQTADEQILQGGTGYITDVGMCGPKNSVLGMDREVILKKFLTGLSQKFQVADEEGVLSGVVLSVERETGRAQRIQRIRFEC